MSITSSRVYRLTCNGCGYRLHAQFTTADDAARYGWLVGWLELTPSIWLCQTCEHKQPIVKGTN